MFHVKHGHHAASSREPGYVEVYRRSIETRARAMPSPGWDSVRNEREGMRVCVTGAGAGAGTGTGAADGLLPAAPEAAVAVDVAGRTDRVRRIFAR